MTILVSDLGDTVVANFKRWSDELADFTVLPKAGIWRSFLNKHPWLLRWLQQWTEYRARKKRLIRGFSIADPRSEDSSATSSDLQNREDILNDPEHREEEGHQEHEEDFRHLPERHRRRHEDHPDDGGVHED